MKLRFIHKPFSFIFLIFKYKDKKQKKQAMYEEYLKKIELENAG